MNLQRIQEKEEVNHQNENYPAKTRAKDSDRPSLFTTYQGVCMTHTCNESQYNKSAFTAPPVELIFNFSGSNFHHWERSEGRLILSGRIIVK